MAIVHQYDKDGFYVGPTNDYGGGMPNGCASEAPPETLPNGKPIPANHKYRRLNPGKFELVADYRGQTGYDQTSGEAMDIKSFGPWPDNLAKEPKPGQAYEWRCGQWVYNIKLDRPGDGYEFDNAVGSWIKTRFSVFSFLNLFTLEEKAAIKKTIAEGNYEVAAIYDSFITADYVDIRYQATVDNVWHLASVGLLQHNQRPDEILKGLPHDHQVTA